MMPGKRPLTLQATVRAADGKVKPVKHKPEDLPSSSLNLLTAFGRKAKKINCNDQQTLDFPVAARFRQRSRLRAK
jgi:hypothetical protein